MAAQRASGAKLPSGAGGGSGNRNFVWFPFGGHPVRLLLHALFGGVVPERICGDIFVAGKGRDALCATTGAGKKPTQTVFGRIQLDVDATLFSELPLHFL